MSAASQPDLMLVTNGGAGEEEAMLNEDSLLCLVEDVDGACDALGENAVSPSFLPFSSFFLFRVWVVVGLLGGWRGCALLGIGASRRRREIPIRRKRGNIEFGFGFGFELTS